jgi:hypothetical protein
MSQGRLPEEVGAFSWFGCAAVRPLCAPRSGGVFPIPKSERNHYELDLLFFFTSAFVLFLAVGRGDDLVLDGNFARRDVSCLAHPQAVDDIISLLQLLEQRCPLIRKRLSHRTGA